MVFYTYKLKHEEVNSECWHIKAKNTHHIIYRNSIRFYLSQLNLLHNRTISRRKRRRGEGSEKERNSSIQVS
jgi:hypothetical protein